MASLARYIDLAPPHAEWVWLPVLAVRLVATWWYTKQTTKRRDQ